MTGDAAARERLETERAATVEQVAGLAADVAGIIAATPEGNDDEHDPEGQTIAFERAQATALLERARAHLAAIDHALERVASGDYATCERCGAPVGAERHEARPAATTCVACATPR